MTNLMTVLDTVLTKFRKTKLDEFYRELATEVNKHVVLKSIKNYFEFDLNHLVLLSYGLYPFGVPTKLLPSMLIFPETLVEGTDDVGKKVVNLCKKIREEYVILGRPPIAIKKLYETSKQFAEKIIKLYSLAFERIIVNNVTEERYEVEIDTIKSLLRIELPRDVYGYRVYQLKIDINGNVEVYGISPTETTKLGSYSEGRVIEYRRGYYHIVELLSKGLPYEEIDIPEFKKLIEKVNETIYYLNVLVEVLDTFLMEGYKVVPELFKKVIIM